jgi:hypothetical protein
VTCLLLGVSLAWFYKWFGRGDRAVGDLGVAHAS